MRLDDRAAYAVNWRTVLAVDASLGVAVVVAGLVLARRGAEVAGVLLAVAGVAYAALVARRYLRWRRLRAEAGLP